MSGTARHAPAAPLTSVERCGQVGAISVLVTRLKLRVNARPGLVAMLAMLGLASPAAAQDLIAINVLIEPGGRMLEEAARWNASLREQSPEGFALDATHRPHLTLLQRHVAVDDLPAVLAAVDGVRRQFDIAGLEMTATGLYHWPMGERGLAGITVAPTPELLALQQAVIEAVNKYHRGAAGEAAYFPEASGTPFETRLLGYVETFVPEQVGARFNPHVTVGIAPVAWLERVEAQPFEPFEFPAADLAVYQLGNFGTAAKRLDVD